MAFKRSAVRSRLSPPGVSKRFHHVPWKLNIVIMMQLWEGNSKGNFFSVSISKLRWVKIQFLAKKLLETWACIIQLYREPIGLSMSWLVLKSERSEHLVFVLFTNQKPSVSGFWFERRNDEARERITQGVSQAGFAEFASSISTKVKLKRAQGECLGIRSRWRTW